jgi:hypothetical protein
MLIEESGISLKEESVERFPKGVIGGNGMDFRPGTKRGRNPEGLGLL